MQNPFVANAMREVPRDANVKLISDTDSAKDVQWEVKKHSRSGSIFTDHHLRVKIVPQSEGKDKTEAVLTDVYALGDCAILEGTAYPATAQVASQKADWLAKRFNKGEAEDSGFTWKNMGVMAYIGNWNALLQAGGGGNISGRAAWIIWRGAYLTKSVSWRNRMLIPIYW
jgi:NADH dehydrogenase FAD-containing subunit